MSETTSGTAAPGEERSGETAEAADLLHEYADILADFQAQALAARRFGQLPGVVEALNNGLDTSKDAFYAELGLRSVTYTRDETDRTWKASPEYYVQGQPRPFIGDQLILAEDDLLLVDRARQVGVGRFVRLQIRPKQDEAVGRFSDEQAVGTIRKLGEVASETDTIPSLTTDRWGHEQTEPPLE